MPARENEFNRRPNWFHLEAGDLSEEGLRGDGLEVFPERRGGSGGALLSRSCADLVNRNLR